MRQNFATGTFYNGDCFDVIRSLPDQSVDMVLCDLPYGEVNQKSSGLRLLDRGAADRCDFSLDDFVGSVFRVCSGSFYVFCGTQQISPLVESFRQRGLTTRVGVWEKSNPSPMNGSRLWLSGLEFCVFARKSNAVFNEHCQKALWRSPSGRSKTHPTEKPVPLFQRLIEASTNPGMTVLDNTAGSGTTAIAAINANRRWICIERDEGYYAKAVERVRQRTGEVITPEMF